MTMAFMVAGGVIAAGGLIAVLFGIPVKEFSTGNLLILSGVAAFCSGLLLVALGAVLGELRRIAALLEPQAEPAPPPAAEPRPLRPSTTPDLFTPDDEAAAEAAATSESPPWARPLREARLPEPPAPTPAREEFPFRRPGKPPAEEPESREWSQPESPRTMFDTLWPGHKRDDEAHRRPSGDIPPAAEPEPAPPAEPAAEPAEPAPVTIIKSGVIEGMAYSLFSDGSIEAELADGTIRFASLDELRAHLDRRT